MDLLILLNGKGKSGKYHMKKSTMEGTRLKCDGRSEVSRGQGTGNCERNKGIIF